MLKNRRHNPEQIIRKLREADQLLASGSSVAAAARELGVSELTYHRWRIQYGRIEPSPRRLLSDPFGRQIPRSACFPTMTLAMIVT
ncbi:MAG: transposase [Acidimicrobiia bacterium]|nr:transposase [Acidimicrobiia bacterium]